MGSLGGRDLPRHRLALPAAHHHRRRRVADGRGVVVRPATASRGRARVRAVRRLLRHRAGGAGRGSGRPWRAGAGATAVRQRIEGGMMSTDTTTKLMTAEEFYE